MRFGESTPMKSLVKNFMLGIVIAFQPTVVSHEREASSKAQRSEKIAAEGGSILKDLSIESLGLTISANVLMPRIGKERFTQREVIDLSDLVNSCLGG
ncbi:hypothetical protein E4U43_006788 [Claviceps pusilla]|uniref:Uncharacterized protein n=1 Tax=Claviceps pusilla TaxID=123648 RepID=A0A9P7N216_9HYPO|nr:hypothetical protein E4U43_006788 [Claviceps pusilla]